MKQQALDKINNCIDTACKYYPDSLGKFIVGVSFNLNGVVAGRVYRREKSKYEIRLNPTLMNNNPTDFIEQTIPHEVSHVIALQLAKGKRIKPHGELWQSIMYNVFGLEPKVTHNYSMETLKNRVHYRCACRDHFISVRKHNNLREDITRYVCKYCGDYLLPVNYED